MGRAGKKAGIAPFLTLLLVLSVCLNAILLLTEQEHSQWADSPVGTYSTVDASSPAAADGLYLALDRDGIYCLYRQGERLAEGCYEEAGQRDCYVLHPADMDSADTQLIWTGEAVYWLGLESIELFYKFSDTPTYINIS